MTERRPFPPSPRRLVLARQAGVTAASPLLVGAAALGAALIATVILARAAGSLIGGWIVAACGVAELPAPDAVSAIHGAPAGQLATTPQLATASHGAGAATATWHDASALLDLDHLLPRMLELAAPLVVAAALAALVAHVAQTRALWSPRRRIAGAPAVPPARVARTALDMLATATIGAVALGWLWTTAPRIGALFALDSDAAPAAVGSALASLVVALAIAYVALSVVDALLRRAQLARALAMTVAEKREDDRLAAADPRWRAQRHLLARAPAPSPAVARAALVLLGDDIAVAIAWNAQRQPIPMRTIVGRGARATQLLGLARRHRVAVHRDAQLATALADDDGPVPEAHWARLAEIIAAVQPSHTGTALSR